MRIILKFLLVFFLTIILADAYSQEAGMPFIRNFQPVEYRAGRQNWSIAQDRRGVMYFGNNEGVLEYDGINWQLIKLPGVKALAIDTVGRIWVGMETDLGYLEPDYSGNLHYSSIKSKIPESHRDQSTVLHICILKNKVIFQTSDELLIYEDGQVTVITSDLGFQNMVSVYNRLYIREREKGLFCLENNTLKFIKGSELFATERINSIMPYGDKELLIITRIKGLFVYSPDREDTFFKPGQFAEVDKLLLNDQADCAALLPDGDIAVGTVTGGIVVFNVRGTVKSRYNRGTGLQDNSIYCLFSDSNNQLWAATDNGISLIHSNLPFCYYSEQNNLNGTPGCLKYFNNRFYVGTSQYLHYRNSQGNFEIIPGTGGQNFCLIEAFGSLLLAKSPGIFEIKNVHAVPVDGTLGKTFLTLATFKKHPGYVLAGSYDGMYLLEKINSSWKLKRLLKGFNKTVYALTEDNNGDIWVSTSIDLYKLKIDSAFNKVITSEKYSIGNGLPSEYAFPVRLNSGELVFSTRKGIYRYLREKDRFEIHPDFKMLTGDVLPFVQMDNGDIWFNESLENGNNEKGFLKLTGNKFVKYKTPFLKFIDVGCSQSPYNICAAPDSTVFIGTTSGLLQYNPEFNIDIGHSFHTLIRKVFSGDSLLFGGSNLNSAEFENIEGKAIPFSQNDVIFNFAATFYEDSEKNLYSYRLTGSDTAWSAWSGDHKKEYTNLGEGRYLFEVRSKNQYQKTGITASYRFEVMSPWYRTWLAYFLYLILGLLLIWLIVRFNIERLLKQKEQLEKTVAERTAEVVAQKKQIEKAHNEITASINYAKYIQSSVFPKTEDLKSCLGNYFILHKPVEIVSGDFYWVSQKDRKTIVVAADCTGHGVPGAFMSMLGITLLDEIVNKGNITDPGAILNRLREEVIDSLQQKGERGEQKDGMDIAVCTFDPEELKMQFAGANNPLYLIREADVENSGISHPQSGNNARLTEIKGNRMPIGIFDEMDEFTVHEIEISKGDTYYLFTDGFPDQFGGPKRRKFSYKQFRELLLKTQAQLMDDQKYWLEESLNEWMGITGQTDDILVIGFRIE